jgi:hypothetical protein
LLKLAAFFGVIALGFLLLVRGNSVELVTPASPVTAVPVNTPPAPAYQQPASQQPVYQQPTPAPVYIRPAPVVVLPAAPSYPSRDFHGHEEHGR